MALSNLGLIQMGGAMLRPGGSLGDGFLAYGDGLVRDDHMKSTALYRNAQMQSLQSQAQQRQMEIAALQQQAEARKNFQTLFASRAGGQPQQVAPQASPQAGLNGDLGSGTFGIDPLPAIVAKNQPVGAAQPNKELWDALLYKAALDAGYNPDQITGMANARNLGVPKVAATDETTDRLGRPVLRYRDDFGRQIGDVIPKAYEKKFQDLGGKVHAVDGYTGGFVGTSMDKTQTPDSVASNAVAWSRLKEDKRHNLATEANPRGIPVVTASGETILVDPRNAQAVPVTMGGQEVKQGKAAEAAIGKIRDAKDVLELLDTATPLLDVATSSVIGTGIDNAQSFFGGSNKGANASAQLKAIEGALVMKMPRMEGPQSNMDQLLYRQMAGQIGNSTVPREQKKAAMETIRALNEKYAGMAPGSSKPSGGASGGWSARELP